ncbi:hypothetical protein [Micromonospora fulviviridis]
MAQLPACTWNFGAAASLAHEPVSAWLAATTFEWLSLASVWA